MFLPISRSKFVVKCAAKILKIGYQINILCPKIFLNRNFVWGKVKQGKSLFSRKNLKFLIFSQKCLKSNQCSGRYACDQHF